MEIAFVCSPAVVLQEAAGDWEREVRSGWALSQCRGKALLKIAADSELLRARLRLPRFLSVTPWGCQQCEVEGGRRRGIATNQGQQQGQFYLTAVHNLMVETHTLTYTLTHAHKGIHVKVHELASRRKQTKYQWVKVTDSSVSVSDKIPLLGRHKGAQTGRADLRTSVAPSQKARRDWQI